MKTLLTLLLVGMSTTAFSQQSRVWATPSDVLPKGALKDSIKAKQFREEQKKRVELLQFLQRKRVPVNNMPNAIDTKSVPPPVYDHNNGWGFDIYRSQVDNMPILLPDSVNAASLMKMRGDSKILPSIFIQPKIVYPAPKN